VVAFLGDDAGPFEVEAERTTVTDEVEGHMGLLYVS